VRCGVVGSNRGAVFSGEDQAGLSPQGSHREPFGSLASFVSLQGDPGGDVQADARVPVLVLGGPKVGSGPISTSYRTDPQVATFEVYVLPATAHYLAPPESPERHQVERSDESLILVGGEERGHLRR
jgi:hypothetical protein